MSGAVVSLTHLTMGKLALRRLSRDQLVALAGPAPVLNHWTLRAPAGALILDVHPDREAFQDHVHRTTAAFSDPVHRLAIEAFSFLDATHEAAALERLSSAAAPADHGPADDDGRLRGRLVSFNHLPQLDAGQHTAVWPAIARGPSSSVVQFALATPSGPLLVAAYLEEPQLIDDFVALRDALAELGVEVVNEWYAFTDRAHEVALDRLAIGLGRLDG